MSTWFPFSIISHCTIALPCPNSHILPPYITKVQLLPQLCQHTRPPPFRLSNSHHQSLQSYVYIDKSKTSHAKGIVEVTAIIRNIINAIHLVCIQSVYSIFPVGMSMLWPAKSTNKFNHKVNCCPTLKQLEASLKLSHYLPLAHP